MLLTEFARGAADAGIDLTVGYLHEVPLGAQARDRLVRLGIEPQLAPVTSLLNPRDLARVRAQIKAVAPDIVHAHMPGADVFATTAARTLGIPAVTTVHSMDWVAPNLNIRAKMRLIATARRRCAQRV